MNLYASINSNESKKNHESPSLIARLLSSPLRIGVWNEGSISWEYPSGEENQMDSLQMLSVMSMNSTKEYEIIRVRLTNPTPFTQTVKVIVQYHNVLETSSTAFYSPNENAIICFSNNTVTMLGGVINDQGMKQYCIQDMNSCSSASLLRCLNQGTLPLSWLAKGDVCSTYTLETTISSGLTEEGLIWTFHSESEELVRTLKNEIINKIN
jgi:hypothetical protein